MDSSNTTEDYLVLKYYLEMTIHSLEKTESLTKSEMVGHYVERAITYLELALAAAAKEKRGIVEHNK